MTVDQLLDVCSDPLTVRLMEGNEERAYSGQKELLELRKEYGNRTVQKITPIYFGIILTIE